MNEARRNLQYVVGTNQKQKELDLNSGKTEILLRYHESMRAILRAGIYSMNVCAYRTTDYL